MRNRSAGPAAPPKPAPNALTGWHRAGIAPDQGEKREKSGLKIGVSGTRHPAYNMTVAEFQAMLAVVPNVDPLAPTKRMMEVEYRLEKLDPHHRFGADLLPLLRWYLRCFDHRQYPNFFAFLDCIDATAAQHNFRLPQFQADAGVTADFAEDILADWLEFLKTGKGVAYPTLLQRSRYQVNIVGGLVHWRGNHDTATPLTTGDVRTGFGGTGYIWALDRWDKLFTGVSDVAKFHHSSLAMGRAVRGAGEWTVENGVVRRIAGRTGHYRVSIHQLYESVRRMRDVLRLNLQHALVELWERDYRQPDGRWAGHGVVKAASTFLSNPSICTTHALTVDVDSKWSDYGRDAEVAKTQSWP